MQAAQRGTAAQAEAADARQRLQSDLRVAEAGAVRQARELADRAREVGTLRNKVRRGTSDLHLGRRAGYEAVSSISLWHACVSS